MADDTYEKQATTFCNWWHFTCSDD